MAATTVGADEIKKRRDLALLLTDPGVAASFKADPAVEAAKNAMEAGSSTAYVAPNALGALAGLARVGGGVAGGLRSKKLADSYQAKADEANAKYQASLAKALGITPEEMAGGATPAAVNPAAAAAPAGGNPAAAATPPGAIVPQNAPPVPAGPPQGTDPRAALAGALTGPPGAGGPPQGQMGAPPQNPPLAPALDSRGLPSGSLTPQPGSLGGSAADNTLAGGNRALKAAAGLPRSALPTGDIIEQMATAAVPGINVTSRQRDPAKNQKVGGVANSFHLPDETGVEHARDFTPPSGVTMAALGRQLRTKFGPGFDVINEGDHIHVEPSAQAVAALGGGASAAPVSGADAVDTLAGGDSSLPPPELYDLNTVPLPEPLKQPEAPKIPERPKSLRLEVAKQLILGGGDPSLLRGMLQSNFEAGSEEDFQSRKEAFEAEKQQQNMLYNSQLQTWMSDQTRQRDLPFEMRRELFKENLSRMSEYEKHKYKMLENQVEDGGALTDDALDTAVELYRQYGLTPQLGAGRVGSSNRARFYNRLAGSGGSAAEIAADVGSNIVQFTGDKAASRAVGTIGGKADFAANELAKSIPLVIQASNAVPRGNFVPLNKVRQWSHNEISSNPQMARLLVTINQATNAYDLLAARGGTDAEKRAEARKSTIYAAQSPEALQAALDAMQQEAQVVLEATRTTRADLRAQARGGGGGGGGNSNIVEYDINGKRIKK